MKVALLEPAIKAVAQKGNVMIGGFLVIQCITNSIVKTEDHQNLFLKSIEILVAAGDALVTTIIQGLSALTTINGTPQETEAAVNLLMTK